MLDYNTCRLLKEAGFPHGDSGSCFGVHVDPLSGKDSIWCESNENNETIDYDYWLYIPTLSELIEACGEELHNLTNCGNFWQANWKEGFAGETAGKTPEEAVANLYLKLYN